MVCRGATVKNYNEANLKNIFEAMSALLVMIVYLAKLRDKNSHLNCGNIFWMKSMSATLISGGAELPDKT